MLRIDMGMLAPVDDRVRALEAEVAHLGRQLAAARQAADAEGDVEGDRTGRDDLDGRPHVVAESHHRALAELLVDLRERRVEGLVAVCCWSHVCHPGG